MKRNSILDRIREYRSKYIDIFVDYTFDLSSRIQFLLDNKSMEQKDLAKALGKSESEVSKWLSGSHNFTLKTIAKIEEVLEDKLLEVVDNTTKNKDNEVYVFLSIEELYKPTNSRLDKGNSRLKKYSNVYNSKTLISADC